ncbi:MAG TPA: ABC transporter ATP-binding protein [Patescibacteria group bacterium]|jgi:ATP-binding cassette subfamily B protein|nr:ABC transporter ATP-binding protein [Patescibacteria group bacterium]
MSPNKQKSTQSTRSSNLEKETLSIFWSVIWGNKPIFLRSLSYLVGVIGINVVTPYFISMALAGLATHRGDIMGYLLPLIIGASVGLLGNWFGFANVLKLNASSQYDLLQIVLDKLLQRSVGFHSNTIGGKLVSNALDYPSALGKLIDTVYINVAPFLLIMFVGIGIVLSRSLPMGLALVGLTGITLALIVIESRRRSKLRVERKKATNNMIAHVSDTIVNAQAVKTFAREDDELKQHKAYGALLLGLRLRDWTSTARSGTARMGVLIALQIIFIAFVGYLLHRDPSVLAIGIFSFSYMITLTNRLFEVGSMIRNIEEAFLMAASMTEIFLEPTEIVDLPKAKRLVVKEGIVKIDAINFSYHEGSSEENVFKDLTLNIPSGQRVGLVGPSGGGKSTLTRLLLRFDDVDQGSIVIDSQDIRQVTQASLRQAISYVPQEPLLFHRSIFDNIAYGKPNATSVEVQAASELAYASDFINKLSAKYDTIVGERGVKLSGGQRQRVAIARAILKDAPILILDEATSALDSESEVYIQKALEQLMKNRTTLVIAHRLSTIQKMDRIIVLNDGMIVEDGTHTELLAKPGLYAKLWSHQSGGFIED